MGTASSGLGSVDAARLQHCLRCGISHLEFDLKDHGVDPATPEGVRQLGEMAARVRGAGMVLWSVHLPFGGRWDIAAPDPEARAEAISRQESLVEAAALWGAGVAVVHGSAEPIPDGVRDERMRIASDGLQRLSERSHSAGIRLAVECLPRTCLGNRSGEVRRWLGAASALSTCCDVNHLFHESPAAYIRALGPRLSTLHLSDNDGVDERHWLPGRGVISWTDVVTALAEVGYQGPLMFEVSGREPEDLAEAGDMLRAAVTR